ncbi:MAG: hypothetical protein GY868_03300 [Deltaproteobacteria bacterium]|nr:hypothetical protein [Deltaproteobacteria bacterium]
MDNVTYPFLHETNNNYDDFLAAKRCVAHPDEGIIAITDENKSLFEASDDTSCWQNFLNGRQKVTFTPQQLTGGLTQLKSDFNMSMGGALAVFDLQSPALSKGFEKITKSLYRERMSDSVDLMKEAFGQYREALKHLDQQILFSDALRSFNKSIEGHQFKALAYLYIGHIYHYQPKNCDFRKAWDHYKLACTFSEGKAGMDGIATLGYFYAGWISGAVFGNYIEAIDLTEKALKINPKLSEAQYHLVKLHAVKGDHRSATEAFKTTMQKHDHRYCRKAEHDHDLNTLHDMLNKVIYETAENDLAELQQMLDSDPTDISDDLKWETEDKTTYARKLLDTPEYDKHKQAAMLLAELQHQIHVHVNAEHLRHQQEQESKHLNAIEEIQQQAADESRRENEAQARLLDEERARQLKTFRLQRRQQVRRTAGAQLLMIATVFALVSLLVYGINVPAIMMLLCIVVTCWLWKKTAPTQSEPLQEDTKKTQTKPAAKEPPRPSLSED